MTVLPAPALAPGQPLKQIGAIFAQRRRIHIPGFLTADFATALYQHLDARADWVEIFNDGDQVFEISPEQWAGLSASEQERIDAQIRKGGRSGFQYRYLGIRTSDNRAERRARGSLLDAFAEHLCSDEALAFFRAATGFDDIVFADAQATRYTDGHFLTCHDDAVEGKHRRAAFVCNLTPQWRAEWGGLLMFHAEDGHIDEALVPSWNAINIFAVPQPHSVSWVCNLAPFPRYAITGWLRTDTP